MWEKLKYLVSDQRIFYFFVFSLLLIAAFLLGRISVQLVLIDQLPEAQITMTNSILYDETFTVPLSSTTDGSVYASINGTRYYGLDCSAGQRIETQNRLYFLTTTHAQAAGYTPSDRCVFTETI